MAKTLRSDIKDKVLKGAKKAFHKLISERQKEDSFIVVSQNGKVIFKKARSFKTKEGKTLKV